MDTSSQNLAQINKGLDPIERQGDGQPVSGRGVYIHDGSKARLEAQNQPQADAFLRMGFRLATADEAKEYQKDVLKNVEDAKNDSEAESQVVINRNLTTQQDQRDAANDVTAEAQSLATPQVSKGETPETVSPSSKESGELLPQDDKKGKK